MTDETNAGCAVCDPEGHPPKSRDDIMADLRAAADGKLQIAHHDLGWALIAKTPFWDDDMVDMPVVLYAGLHTKEAATVALNSAMASYLDETVNHNPLGYDGPHDDPVKRFNAVGRILAVLEEADSIADLSKPDWVFIATRAYNAALDDRPPHCVPDADDEPPF